MKPSFNEVSSSSDSCLELGTYTASKLRDYLFSTTQFRVTIKPCGCWALPIHISLPFWYVAYATFLFLGSGANASLKLWALFMLQ